MDLYKLYFPQLFLMQYSSIVIIVLFVLLDFKYSTQFWVRAPSS